MTSRELIIAFGLWASVALPTAQVVLHAQIAEVNPFHLSSDHATASVADLDREYQWYQQVLGFRELKPPKREPEREVRYLSIPGYRLDLVWQKGSVRHQVTPGPLEQGWLNLCFKTSDIDLIYKHLIELGIKVKVDRRPQGTP